jgi:hypothetical protein
MTTNVNSYTLCHAKQLAAAVAAVVTSLPPTLSHQCGHSAIAKMREVVIALGINIVCGFINQGVKVSIATVTFPATMKLQSNNDKLSIQKF